VAAAHGCGSATPARRRLWASRLSTVCLGSAGWARSASLAGLEEMSGGVRVYEPSTDLYVAYEYRATERGESLQYGSNSPTALSVRLPVRWRGTTRRG